MIVVHVSHFIGSRTVHLDGTGRVVPNVIMSPDAEIVAHLDSPHARNAYVPLSNFESPSSHRPNVLYLTDTGAGEPPPPQQEELVKMCIEGDKVRCRGDFCVWGPRRALSS